MTDGWLSFLEVSDFTMRDISDTLKCRIKVEFCDLSTLGYTLLDKAWLKA